MRILCCLDGTNIEQLSKAVSTFLPGNATTVGLLYVIDTGPQRDMELRRERSLRSRHSGPLRSEQMRQAEQYAAQDVLEEAKRYFERIGTPELLQRRGRPEREIVNCAAEWHSDLLVICPHSSQWEGPALGPKSVGHVARFVLDHAPCPVLLVRPLSRSNVPLPG
jgi:nucleotide-binding universal stress UspA family protein